MKKKTLNLRAFTSYSHFYACTETCHEQRNPCFVHCRVTMRGGEQKRLSFQWCNLCVPGVQNLSCHAARGTEPSWHTSGLSSKATPCPSLPSLASTNQTTLKPLQRLRAQAPSLLITEKMEFMVTSSHLVM